MALGFPGRLRPRIFSTFGSIIIIGGILVLYIYIYIYIYIHTYRGAEKSLARPERKQATATEDFDVYISYL